MKICHIIFSFLVGGAETMLVDIINEQAKTEDVSLVIINTIIDHELKKNISPEIEIVEVNRIQSSKNIVDLIRLNYHLWRINADFYHYHSQKAIKLVFPLLRKNNGLTIHATGISCSNFTKYKKLFSISNAVKEDIKIRSGLDSTVVANGIYFDKIKPRETTENRLFRMVQVARLDHQIKGQDLLINAIHHLLLEDDYPIVLDIIGDGDSLPFLKEAINKSGIHKRVNLLGLKSRNYIYSHLHEYDLLVLPSRNEGFGLAVIEAMAAKVPVLVSDIDPLMETIKDGAFGYFFESGNETDLKVKLAQIIKAQNHPFIETAYQYVMDNFDIKNTAKQYIKNYKR